jgi:hypothetical protein
MPRFFFHLTNGKTIPDDKATPCRTAEEAKVVALAIAAELGRNKPPEEIKELAICVTDQTGKEVFRTNVVNLQQSPKANAIVDTLRRQSG